MTISFRPLLPKENDYERWFAVLIPVVWALGAAMLWVAKVRLFCPFYALTTIPCASCGSTRATHALAHGDIFSALAFNPLWTLVCAASVAYWLYCVGAVLLRRNQRLRIEALTAAELRAFRICAIAAFLFNWAWVVFRELG